MLSAALMALHLNASLGEVTRGVWLTTTANRALESKQSIDDTMARLKAIGLNTVYVETWKNGYTQFPSRELRKRIGVDRHPNLKGKRDLLREAVDSAHRHGLRCIAWFEYGFMAASEGFDNELVRLHPEWLTTTRDGKRVSTQNPFLWMNPARPECQELLLGIIMEAARKYPIDGIQLDDRIAWPTTMGYDDFTRKLYAAQNDGAAPPDDPRAAGWIAWRAAQVDAFAERLDRTLRQASPKLTISISPAVYPWSYENYACNWPKWEKAGWMHEFVPQVYRADPDSFARDWQAQIAAVPGAGRRLIAGVMLDQGEKPVPWPIVESNLRAVEASGHGVVLWFSRAVLGGYEKQLTKFFRASSSPSGADGPSGNNAERTGSIRRNAVSVLDAASDRAGCERPCEGA